MSIPTAVTQRAEGTGYIGVTGMEFAVQTGFAIRTGFYLTNSGTTSVRMTLELDSSAHNFDQTYDFISGTYDVNDDRRVTILAGSTKFIPFDFYGLKSTSGPQSPITGPAGTGSYNTAINLSFISEIDGSQDRTYYAGQPELGVIRVNLTGYVTGHFGSTSELTPAHPQKFLGITGQKDDLGVYYHDLRWVNPPTGYYFEKYKIERSTDATQNWSALTTIEIPKIDRPTTLPPAVGGTYLNSFYYGTPTGIDGYNTYSDTNLTASTDYYYRIRGEHYDSSNTSTLISYSDWVYCSGVDSFSQSVSNDVLTGLVSGSTNLEPGDNPDPTIKLSTAEKGALEIYLRDGETNVNLNNRFNQEITNRGITKTNFLDYFTGVHFIIDENYTIGSSKYQGGGSTGAEPAISTGGKVEVGAGIPSELKMNLYLREGARIIGLGGKGGNAGLSKVTWDTSKQTDGIQFESGTPALGRSSVGAAGGTAIYISDTSISQFKIYLPSSFSIYGGGGGGGGGDTIFAARAAALVREARQANNVDDERTVYFQKVDDSVIINLTQSGGSTSIGSFSIEDLQGIHTAGFGGGGQGYPNSLPGKTHTGNAYPAYLNISNINKGNMQRPGAGRAANINQLVSQGGDGGAFGQFGASAPSSTFAEGTFRVGVNDDANDGPNGKVGGRGGYAIHSRSTTYTTSNIFGTLLFSSIAFQPSSISGFVARWDASTTVYNTGTTDATNGQTVENWIAAEKNSSITDTVKIEGGSSKPTFYTDSTRTQYFNSKPSIEFNGNNSATIQKIVGVGDYKLNNDIDSFDIFYVVFPNSFGSSKQFENGFKTNNSSFEFSKFEDSNRVHQTLYSGGGEIQERTGMINTPSSSYLVPTQVSQNTQKPMPSYAFVYNVTAQRNGSGFIYRSYINNILKIEYTVNNMSNLSFKENPILGKYARGSTSFNISDIVIYRRQLLEKERDSVYLYLTQRARLPLKMVTPSTNINTDTPNNKVEDETGFAGHILLQS